MLYDALDTFFQIPLYFRRVASTVNILRRRLGIPEVMWSTKSHRASFSHDKRVGLGVGLDWRITDHNFISATIHNANTPQNLLTCNSRGNVKTNEFC